MNKRTDRPQHRGPKAPIAAQRHEEWQRYRLTPEFIVRLVLWLAHHTPDHTATLDRDSLIQMLCDWKLTTTDRHALQKAMAGTKIPHQFALCKAPDYLLVFMVRVAADGLLAVN